MLRIWIAWNRRRELLRRTRLSCEWNALEQTWSIAESISISIRRAPIRTSRREVSKPAGPSRRIRSFRSNIDTTRAGLWSGGLFHFTVQSRYGSSREHFTVGSFRTVLSDFPMSWRSATTLRTHIVRGPKLARPGARRSDADESREA